jgi:sugar phosphate isomerase/epimerase
MRKSMLCLIMPVFIFVNAHAEDSAAKSHPEWLSPDALFVFDNGVGQNQWTPEQQAETLDELGYAGIGYSGTGELDERLAAFDRHDLRIFNLYVECNLSNDPPFGDDLRVAIRRLAGTDVTIWLTVRGESRNDDKAVQYVREIAKLAKASRLKVALYPHSGFYVEHLDDALRIVRKVDRKNLGVTFNLCHELMAGNEARFDEILENAASKLFVVSINGAGHSGGWDQLIQPLGQGPFDLDRLLRKLIDIKYRGPVGLQCYAVPGDTRTNLENNIAQWRKIVEQLREEKR